MPLTYKLRSDPNILAFRKQIHHSLYSTQETDHLLTLSLVLKLS